MSDGCFKLIGQFLPIWDPIQAVGHMSQQLTVSMPLQKMMKKAGSLFRQWCTCHSSWSCQMT